MLRRMWWFLLPTCLLAAGCQDYGFEELPSVDFNTKRWSQTITMSTEADILFVVDNSASMTGEQRQLGVSFNGFMQEIQTYFGEKYHIAVITTGIQSDGCPVCDSTITGSCMNESGEGGRFQERLGKNVGTEDAPVYDYKSDPSCRLVTSDNKSCFYDSTPSSANYEYGTALTGINGCGYERGLEAMRKALGSLTSDWNAGFLRPSATLAVVMITDEEDCGKEGDVTENLPNISGNICYYAAKGKDPEDKETDPNGKPLKLASVSEYYNFMLGLKGGREGMVKFAAVVGVGNLADPDATKIDYQFNNGTGKWDVLPACTTAGCTGRYCFANPGTRYIELAQMFGIGKNGFLDTICQTDFSETMKDIGAFVGCPRRFKLSEPILDPDLASILINGTEIPLYSCSIQDVIEECSGPTDTSCSSGSCVPTWIYCPPSGASPAACVGEDVSGTLGGIIKFADHYDPCTLFKNEPGAQVTVELVYVTK